jgi:acetyl-CoA acyltransferase
MKTKAYIVKAYRTAVGKAPKGVLGSKDLMNWLPKPSNSMNELPDFDKTCIDDVMVGNAMPRQNKDLTWVV